ADGEIPPTLPIHRAPPSDRALPAGRTARHHSELRAACGSPDQYRPVGTPTARKLAALRHSLATASACTIHRDKFQPARSRRRQGDRRRPCWKILELLASGL